MRYVVRVTDCGPLSFRSGRETAAADSLPYIPGSALLGALASAHAQLRHDPTQFDGFFTGPESGFSNLYPAMFKRDALQGGTDPVRPLPTTALTCKRFKGFQDDYDAGDRQQDHPHGAFDSLIPWALFALSGQTDAGALEALKACPQCGEPLDRFDGFYRRDCFDAQIVGRAEVGRGLRTRTGIHRATGAVQQGILYSRQVLYAGSQFWGMLSVPDATAGEFEAFVQEAQQSGLLRVGNNRSRGFGRITLQLDAMEDEDTARTLAERVQGFDAELRSQAVAAGIAARHALYLPLTLTSDAILPDQLLRYQRVITPEYLAEEWGIAGAELVYHNSGTRRVMGWNDLWRLPKPDDVAITMGSVFLFGLQGPLDDAMRQSLLNMQVEGIGVRRREGFGQLVVAGRFHSEVKGQ